MAYVALKRWKGREPGEAVPEAAGWKNPKPWVDFGWVKEVPDAEIKNGRWVNFVPPGGRKAPAPPAPPKPEPKPAPEAIVPEAPKPTAKQLLEAKTKAQLLEIADELGIDTIGSASKKREMVEAILESGGVVVE